MDLARRFFRECGIVAVDPKLVEAYTSTRPDDFDKRHLARLAIADAVLAALDDLGRESWTGKR